MTSRTTKAYKKTLSGSIGAGMGSLFAPGGKKYYILEHKVTSKYHRAGESQEIIVDNIELGRDSHCQVRFDETFRTVSRRHAAIVKDGDMWKLVQLSKTNTTFLNGRPVKDEWYLQNGDEIQLSVNGPKMGFITPTGKKSTVGSIGLTRRLSLFRQQALRPYKTAITVLSCVLVLAVGGLGTWSFSLNSKLVAQSEELAKQIVQNAGNKEKLAKLHKDLAASNKKIADYEKDIEKAKNDIKNAKTAANRAVSYVSKRITVDPGKSDNTDIEKCFPDVYFIQTIPYYNGKPLMDGCFIGTGFMLSNGYFVTAQHVVNIFSEVDVKRNSQGEAYIDPSGQNTLLNAFWNTLDIHVKMVCTSTKGSFTIEYSSQNIPFRMGKAKEAAGTFKDEAGRTWAYRQLSFGSGDWACIKVNNSGNLNYAPGLSKSLKAQTTLNIVGFPNGLGADGDRISPVCSQAIAAQSGLNSDGCILTSNNNTDGGNSGGPVLVRDGEGYKVVGIHVGIYGGRDDTKGRVVPIGNVF
ncbi:MAG: FHA domain-containing protein [Prevotella sp.]